MEGQQFRFLSCNIHLLLFQPALIDCFNQRIRLLGHNIVITHKRGDFIRSMDIFNLFQTSFHAVIENPAQKTDTFYKISPKRIHKNPWKQYIDQKHQYQDRKAFNHNFSHTATVRHHIDGQLLSVKRHSFRIFPASIPHAADIRIILTAVAQSSIG